MLRIFAAAFVRSAAGLAAVTVIPAAIEKGVELAKGRRPQRAWPKHATARALRSGRYGTGREFTPDP